MLQPAIFLDRDGVIVENRSGYIRSWNDIQVFPQAIGALAEISASPFKMVIVTNQSAVGRGLLTLQIAMDINQRMIQVIEQAGGRIDGVFMCPHLPEAQCECRKPKPGLLLQAARTLSLDLQRSVMIGDALSDIQAGQAAGVRETVLVRTGRGADQAQIAHPAELKPFRTYDTLAAALANLAFII